MTPICGQSGRDKPVRRTKALVYSRVFSAMIWMVFAGGLSVQADNLNEWTFESDANGLPLSGTTNCGSNSPLAQFSAGFGSTVFTANRTLICIGTDDGTGGAWTNGAILDATPVSSASGVSYLRYDVAYNFNPSTNNNSGAVLGVYFTGASNAVADRVAGMVLGYDISGTLASAVPSTRRRISVTSSLKTGLSLSGTLTAIAEVNLSLNTLKVWYGVNGSIPTDYSAAAFTVTNNGMTSITNLRFHATGDFRPTTADSANYAAVDNIRVADNWADITAPIPNFSKGPKIEIARIIITTPKGTFTNSSKMVVTSLGATNKVEVLIRSLGSSASNVTSSVIAAAPEYSLITSNNPTAIRTYPEYATNTFSVVIKPNASNDATYVFNVGATADGAAGVFSNFTLTAGALMVYKTNSIKVALPTVDLPFVGILSNKYEPGETLEITVTNENAGLRDINNVVNALLANPAYFAITNLTSTNYPLVAVGATAATTYRVTILPAATDGTHWFSVINQSGSLPPWSDSFSIDVFKQGIPSVYPTSITNDLLKGASTTNRQVTVDNSGNGPLLFYITDDGPWDTFYNVTTVALGSGFVAADRPVVLNDPEPPAPYTSAENAGVSSALNIGFNFPFYGTVYSNFYVTADGYIGLINTTNTPITASANRTGALTGGDPLIAPFWGQLNSPAGSIKTIRSANNYLVISYIGASKEFGGTDLQFQVALFTNGCVEFRYKNIDGITNTYGTTNVTIGIQGSKSSYTNLAEIKPGSGTLIRLTPQRDRWVTYPTQTVGLDPQDSAGIIFKADATRKTGATNVTFNAWFNWSSGGSNAVIVTVNVMNAAPPVYSAVPSLSFTGSAAQVTSAQFIITNAGGSPLTFTINDTNTQAFGYTSNYSWQVISVVSTNSAGVISTNTVISTNSLVYNWIDISATGTDITYLLMDPDPSNPYITEEDEGFSDMIPLKEEFPFYGGCYTQVCVSVNGALRLDKAGRILVAGNLAAPTNSLPQQMIAPYWGDLVLDENATIKYLSTDEQLVVTWENVRQYGLGGGADLTFQAILTWNGDITFQYKKLEGLPWPGTTIGLRDTADHINVRALQADITQPGDWTLTTNVYGGVSREYVNAVGNRAVQLQFAQVHVISYTPNSGSIAAGSNAAITITGDASNQSGGPGTISTNTTLSIFCNAVEGGPNTLTNRLDVRFTVTNSLETVFVRAAAGDSDGDGILDDQERIAGTDPQNAGSVFTPAIERTDTGVSLSWPPPQDGVQRTYIIYFTTNLMSAAGWNYLATVTSGTTYSTAHSSAPVIYYKITVQ